MMLSAPFLMEHSEAASFHNCVCISKPGSRLRGLPDIYTVPIPVFYCGITVASAYQGITLLSHGF